MGLKLPKINNTLKVAVLKTARYRGTTLNLLSQNLKYIVMLLPHKSILGEYFKVASSISFALKSYTAADKM